MSWGYVAVGAGAAIKSDSSNKSTAAGKKAAGKAFEAKKGYLENAQGIISTGYKSGRDVTSERTDKAQGYQDPYLEIGQEAKKYFGELNKPGNISKKYKEYLDVGDPLFDYAEKKTSDALQKRLAATGRSDSGFAIEEDLDRSTKIAYQFSDLADRRMQSEIGLQERLLGRGQQAANTSTNLQYNTGQALSNLFTRESDINAAYEAQIGGAAADYENTVGNLNMQNIGAQGQIASGAVNGMAGYAMSGGGGNLSNTDGGSQLPTSGGNMGGLQGLNLTQPNLPGITVPTVTGGSNLSLTNPTKTYDPGTSRTAMPISFSTGNARPKQVSPSLFSSKYDY